MRRSRRGLSGGHEFGGSGEDSFVAVVVTKLTGALLFILLLTMVIMALIPKADEAAAKKARAGDGDSSVALRVITPEALPEAIAGRPYAVALAAEGGSGRLRWTVAGTMPEGLALDPETGLIQGTPKVGTPEPVDVVASVSDGESRASSRLRLVVYKPDSPLSTPSRWAPSLPPIPWRSWMEQGFGFLVLLLVYLVGMNVIGGLERLASRDVETPRKWRFRIYRSALSLGGLGASAALVAWLLRGRVG